MSDVVTDGQKMILIETLMKYDGEINLFSRGERGNVFHHCRTKRMAVFIVEKILSLYRNGKAVVEIKDKKVLNDPVLKEKVRINLLKNASPLYDPSLSEEENLNKGKAVVVVLLKEKNVVQGLTVRISREYICFF
jgi:hypothetical protein